MSYGHMNLTCLDEVYIPSFGPSITLKAGTGVKFNITEPSGPYKDGETFVRGRSVVLPGLKVYERDNLKVYVSTNRTYEVCRAFSPWISHIMWQADHP